jgi:hypothetical protein
MAVSCCRGYSAAGDAGGMRARTTRLAGATRRAAAAVLAISSAGPVALSSSGAGGRPRRGVTRVGAHGPGGGDYSIRQKRAATEPGSF